METRLLILNADPVFQDKSLAIFDQIDELETQIGRTLSEAVSILLGENFDALVVEGEPALAEVFRWRQGRFYFEEAILSQVQTVDRPWAHLLIDNLQKLDETLELVSLKSQS